VVALGDQEWAASDGFLRGSLPDDGKTRYLSTLIQPADPKADLPLVRVVRKQFGEAKLAVVNVLVEDAFLFFDKARRGGLKKAPLAEMESITADLRRDGFAILAIVHGSESELLAVSKQIDADLVVRGHAQGQSPSLGNYGGKPALKVGGSEHVAAVAMRLRGGAIKDLDYRLEVVDKSWPADQKMMEIYQAYSKQAMTQALDAERKKAEFKYVAAESCGRCHPYQYEQWMLSKHAEAFVSLTDVKRQGDPNCVLCHSVGFGFEGGFYTEEKTPELAGVQCQNCHRFDEDEHFRLWKKGKKVPTVIEEVCETCHTPVTDPKFHDNVKKRFADMGCGADPTGRKAMTWK
jgi:nitrate/TMAO reductase-like tetraheme cytochrome c subunit